MPEQAPKLRFAPVTHANSADFEALFKSRGAPGYCWCMAWRATAAELRNASGPERRKQMLARIGDKVPAGLLAYDADAPVGWISVAPRQTFRGLGGPDPQPGDSIWSLTCMFLKRDLRGRGLAHRFIAAAADHAGRQGGTVLEAYPVSPDSPSYRFMGFVPAFEAAGFTHVSMAGSRRHVMRLDLPAADAPR